MKRKIVKNKKEFVDWINIYNGKMNCYTTVYDYDDFTDNAKVDSSVIIDRMFLDFDAHGEPLENAYEDFRAVHEYFRTYNIKHDTIFSGKGFHIIAYGELADDIRSVQRYYTELAKDYPTLDRTGIQTNRLRRIPNTMNLSTDGFYCMPVNPREWKVGLVWEGHETKKSFGDKLIQWPKVKPIELSDVEIEVPKPLGKIPILPCLQNAITVENPSHYARVYLVQWYRDLLSMGVREIDESSKREVTDTIMAELNSIASQDDIWLDWDESTTKKHVDFIVSRGYHAPSCKNVLIPQGYCVGKCWRYDDE
tara:strand:+ start:27779 stop:28702 length:924 start_codon:yes stop_codon:yes gene_type:complete